MSVKLSKGAPSNRGKSAVSAVKCKVKVASECNSRSWRCHASAKHRHGGSQKSRYLTGTKTEAYSSDGFEAQVEIS